MKFAEIVAFLLCCSILRPDQGCFFSTKHHLKLANFLSSKDQKSSKKVSFCDIWLNAIIHESLKFFKKCGFFAIFGKRILRHARVSLWRRSPTGELPSNPAPKATFLEKNRTSVDDCTFHEMHQKSDFSKGFRVFPT